MGLFGDEDIASAQEVSFLLPTDTYHMIVSDVKPVSPTKKGTMHGVTFQYTVVDGKYQGRTAVQWQRVPHPQDTDVQTPEQKETARGYLKKTMLALGVAEDMVNKVNPEDLIGREVAVRLGEKNGNQTVTPIKPWAEVATAGFGGTFQ